MGEAHELPPVSGCETRHLLINDAVRRPVASKRVLQKMLGSLRGCRQLLREDDVSQVVKRPTLTGMAVFSDEGGRPTLEICRHKVRQPIRSREPGPQWAQGTCRQPAGLGSAFMC